MTEKSLEKKVINYLIKLNFDHIKIKDKKGYPDRAILKDGKVFFIEFKSSTGALSKLQKQIIQKLRDSKFDVFIIKSEKDFIFFKNFIDSFDNH